MLDFTATRMVGYVKNWQPRVGDLGKGKTRDEIEASFMKSFQESAKAYFDAADKIPQDDEAHACMYYNRMALPSLPTRTNTTIDRVSQLWHRYLLAHRHSAQGLYADHGTHSKGE